jgi:hypothetical protein
MTPRTITARLSDGTEITGTREEVMRTIRHLRFLEAKDESNRRYRKKQASQRNVARQVRQCFIGEYGYQI